MTGYDTSFPVACAEDIELSYRMSARGWKMKFVPAAIVYHTHPDTFARYLKKKYKFAFWRVLAVRKNPSKGVKDSHTPQIMKLQLLFAPALLLAVALRSGRAADCACVRACTCRFLAKYAAVYAAGDKERSDGRNTLTCSACRRACAQVLGVAGGLIYARRKPVGGSGQFKTDSR